MLREERLGEIEKMLQQYGKVEVANLCRLFGVAEMTIRRDLHSLVERGIAVRSHGGAVLPAHLVLSERPFDLRVTHNREAKRAIAQKALSLLGDGKKVFFDSSTTVLSLAQLITNEMHMLVVTDTISTAMELNSRSNIQVFCIGGELRKNTNSCCGMFAENMVAAMHFDTAFISVPRITPDGVLSTTNTAELPVKRAAMERADQVVLMVDHTKLGGPDFLTQGCLGDIDVLVTDDGMPGSFLELCARMGVRTMVAQAK